MGGVAGLGILWTHRHYWLSGTGYSDHTGSSLSAVGKYCSSSETTSGIGGDASWNVKCWQAPSENGKLPGHLGIRGEIAFLVFSWVKGCISGEY